MSRWYAWSVIIVGFTLLYRGDQLHFSSREWIVGIFGFLLLLGLAAIAQAIEEHKGGKP